MTPTKRRSGSPGAGRQSGRPLFRRRRCGFRHPDHRRAQQPVVQHIARLQYLDDRAGGLAAVLRLEDRLVEIVVEALALGVDAADAVAFEGGEQLALGRRDPFDEAARLLVLDLAGGYAVERAAQIVGRGEQVAGKTGDGVALRLRALALAAAPGVLGLGERAQQAVLALVELGFERGDPRRRRLGFGDRGLGTSFGLGGRVVGGRRRLVLVFHGLYPIRRPIILAV